MTIRTLNKAYVTITLAIIAGIAMPSIQAAQKKNTSLHHTTIDRQHVAQDALHDAVRRGNIDAVRALLETAAGKAQLNQLGDSETSHNCRTPLDIAASWNRLEIAEILIQHGARVNCDPGIKAPLHYVTGPKVARLLIAHGANVNAIDDCGMTPLHRIMVRRPSPEAIAMTAGAIMTLIENGADVDQKTARQHNPYAQGLTPLHVAAKFGNRLGAIFLVEYLDADIYTGADFDNNFTALHYALLQTNQQTLSEEGALMATMLVQRGADLAAESEWQQQPYSFAPEALRKELVKLDKERLQAVKFWAENLQEQHELPTDIVRHLLTFALTEKQHNRLMLFDQE